MIFVLGILFSQVQAQTEEHQRHRDIMHMLNEQVLRTQVQKTTASERLLARSRYDDDGFTVFDSTIYFYSNGRGSNLYLAPTDVSYSDQFDPTESLSPYHTVYENYIMYDSSHHIDQNLTLDVKHNKSYNSQNELTDYTRTAMSNGTIADQKRFSYVYANNLEVFLDYSTAQIPFTGAYDLQERRYSFYNGNLRYSDSTVDFDGNNQNGVLYYSYNPGGLLDTIVEKFWESDSNAVTNQIRSCFVYDSQNRITNALYQVWTSQGWRDDAREEETYQGNNLIYHTLTRETWEASSGTWKNANKWIQVPVGTLIDTTFYYSWSNSNGNWRPVSMDKYEYTAYGHISKHVNYDYDQSLGDWEGTPDYTRHYYYESYTSDVGHTPMQNKPILYPNPNNGSFTLMTRLSGSRPLQLAVTDMLGRQLKQTTASPSGEITITLDVPAGVYFVTVTAEERQYVEKIIVE